MASQPESHQRFGFTPKILDSSSDRARYSFVVPHVFLPLRDRSASIFWASSWSMPVASIIAVRLLSCKSFECDLPRLHGNGRQVADLDCSGGGEGYVLECWFRFRFFDFGGLHGFSILTGFQDFARWFLSCFIPSSCHHLFCKQCSVSSRALLNIAMLPVLTPQRHNRHRFSSSLYFSHASHIATM